VIRAIICPDSHAPTGPASGSSSTYSPFGHRGMRLPRICRRSISGAALRKRLVGRPGKVSRPTNRCLDHLGVMVAYAGSRDLGHQSRADPDGESAATDSHQLINYGHPTRHAPGATRRDEPRSHTLFARSPGFTVVLPGHFLPLTGAGPRCQRGPAPFGQPGETRQLSRCRRCRSRWLRRTRRWRCRCRRRRGRSGSGYRR
jgi:hypothetical protein